jgi:hypothetical protein
MSSLEAFDEPGLPQGPLSVERLGHDPSHETAERRIVTRRGQCRVPQVVAKIEMRVVHPHRPPQLERYRADMLAVSRDQVQFRRDQRCDVVNRRRRVIEYARAGDVHVHDPVLQMEKFGIERIQSLHGVFLVARFLKA